MTHFWCHNEVEQGTWYRRASDTTVEVVGAQKYSKIVIFYYSAKAWVKAQSLSSNTKIKPKLGLGSSSKMKSMKGSKLDNFRLIASIYLLIYFYQLTTTHGKIERSIKLWLHNKSLEFVPHHLVQQHQLSFFASHMK